MRYRRIAGLPVLFAAVLALSGCVPAGLLMSALHTGTSEHEQQQEMEQDVEDALTWQEAKAATQARELEIAALVPAELVVKRDQWTEGLLLSCDKTRHSWTGSMTVTVLPGTDIESIIKDIEAHYRQQFEVDADQNPGGYYRIHIRPPVESEGYIVSHGFEPDQLYISSFSECFTLPEDVYPGGDF